MYKKWLSAQGARHGHCWSFIIIRDIHDPPRHYWISVSKRNPLNKVPSQELLKPSLVKTPECPVDSKEIKPVNPKGNQPWIFIERTDAEAEAPIFWPPNEKSWVTGKRLWFWERLSAWGEGGNRGWDGWMASLTQRTWVWANSGIWCRTGKTGMLQSMGLQSIRHNWETEQQLEKMGASP